MIFVQRVPALKELLGSCGLREALVVVNAADARGAARAFVEAGASECRGLASNWGRGGGRRDVHSSSSLTGGLGRTVRFSWLTLCALLSGRGGAWVVTPSVCIR
jgi:hypothetical protein